MSPATNKFDEGLRTLDLGCRYRWGASSAFGLLFATVEPVASGMRDQLVKEVGASKRIPEIISGINDDSAFNAVSARLPEGRYLLAVNYGALILVHDLVHRLFCLPEFFPWMGDPSKEDLAWVAFTIDIFGQKLHEGCACNFGDLQGPAQVTT